MAVELPLIYRIPLRSQGLGVDHANQVAHCLANGVASPGWGVPPPAPSSLDDALDRLRPISKSGTDTVRRFANAPTGSLVWSRDVSGRYLLGQITGEWAYDDSSEAATVDCQHVRPVAWAPRALLDDEVPAAVVRAWSGLGTSFFQIHSTTARMMSARLYDELTGKAPEPLRVSPEDVLRELLHPFDVEDLVCTFLQAERNYMVLPASHRRDTPAYEQVLISRDDGHRAIAQVKTGDTPVDLDLLRKAAADDAHAFAYSTTGRYLGSLGDVEVIRDADLVKFARQESQYLPARVRRWFEYVEDSPS